MPSRRVQDSWLLPFGLIGLLPLVWATWLLIEGLALSGDSAWMALRTFDVFSSDPPLTGMPSTSSADAEGVNAHHPGPVQYVLLAPLYALSGWSAWALALGSLSLNLGLVAIALWVAWRIGHPGLKVATVSGLFVVTMSQQFGLMHPWNPRPVQMGMIALVLLVWAILIGRTWCWPFFAFVGAIVGQGHLVGLPMFWFAVGVLVLLGWYFGFPRLPAPVELVTTFVVFVAAWVLPAWDLLVNWSGNLGEILAYMTSRKTESAMGSPGMVQVAIWAIWIFFFGSVGWIAIRLGRLGLGRVGSARAEKEWSAGLVVFGLFHVAFLLVALAGGAGRLSYLGMLFGPVWVALVMVSGRFPQWWTERSKWAAAPILVATVTIAIGLLPFLHSHREFGEQQVVFDSALAMVNSADDLPVVVKQQGVYSWLNLYSGTVLELVTNGKDVHYDPVGNGNPYDSERRTSRLEGPRLELIVADRLETGKMLEEIVQERVLAVEEIEISAAEGPITLVLVRKDG